MVYLGRKVLGKRKKRALRMDCYGDRAGGPCGWSRSSKHRETGDRVRDNRVMLCK